MSVTNDVPIKAIFFKASDSLATYQLEFQWLIPFIVCISISFSTLQLHKAF